MSGGAVHATAGNSSDSPRAAPSVLDLEEKARRLLKRSRYGDAAKTFDLVVQEIQLQRHTGTSAAWSRRVTSSDSASDQSVLREIAALEGLAICLSRQLDDAGAEVAQRKALALRCRQWEHVGETGSSGSLSGSGGVGSSTVLEAKRAALPCLRNLASFVSKQGRHVDAEVVLRTVLSILDDHDRHCRKGRHEDASGGGKSALVTPPEVARGGNPSKEEFSVVSVVAFPSRSLSENDMRLSQGVEEEKRSQEEEEEEKEGQENEGIVEEEQPRQEEEGGSFSSLSLSASPCETRNSRSSSDDDGVAEQTRTFQEKHTTLTAATCGRGDTAASRSGSTLPGRDTGENSTASAATTPTTTARHQGQPSSPCTGAEAGLWDAATAPTGEERGGSVTGEAAARLARRTASDAVSTAVRTVGATAIMPHRDSSPPSSPADHRHGSDDHRDTGVRGGVDGAPDPPPPSPVPMVKDGDGSPPLRHFSNGGSGGGGGSYSGSSGSERVGRAGSLGGAGGAGGGGGEGRPRGVGNGGDAEDVEMEDVGRGGQEEEDSELMAAVTRHHLAVVVHAQGRVEEAKLLVEGSLQVLKRRNPPEAVRIAQALHDLAGILRPSDPPRACALYAEALDLLENARGVNHFLTAPTLAKLGSLLGESLVATSDTPPAPAAPAGPGAAGLARSAGLAEAVCAPAGQSDGGSSAASAAVAAAAGGGWDMKEAENMIKRAVHIQGRRLGLRHPAVACSMRAMAELYRRQGRLAEAEPLFRRAIGIWEVSPGAMDSDAVAALHGLAHCVLAGAGADWLGRFEEAFALVDQAYRIASSHPGNGSSARLLLEALRMIRSRQRQGRGNPQPASAAIMEGVWNGRWDPAKIGGGGGGGETEGNGGGPGGGNGDDGSRCAVCLEEVVEGGWEASSEGGLSGGSATVRKAGGDWTADIGSEEGVSAQTGGDAYAGGSSAYLPCGHRFHTYCIGRWLAHSSSCPSCRRRVEDDQRNAGREEEAAETQRGTRDDDSAVAAISAGGGGGGGGDDDGAPSPTAGASTQAEDGLVAETQDGESGVVVAPRTWNRSASADGGIGVERAIAGGSGDGSHDGGEVAAVATRSIGTQAGAEGEDRGRAGGRGQEDARAPYC